MTLPHHTEPLHGVPDLPSDHTLVLIDRPIAPGAQPTSVFSDDRWELTPCLFDEHAAATSVNFHHVPEVFRTTIKYYLWQMINHDPPRAQRRTNGPRPAIRTVYAGFSQATAFVTWAHTHQLTSLADVDTATLDRYLDFVADAEISHDAKEDLLQEVRRLWSYRDRLPAAARLPADPPWGGDDTADLLHTTRRRTRENATPRIPPRTMEVLLMWSLRFVQDFSTDIIAASWEEKRLWSGAGARRAQSGVGPRAYAPGAAEAALCAFLEELRADGKSLPGRIGDNGEVQVHWTHLTRLLHTGTSYFTKDRPRALVLAAGLPIAPNAPLVTPITGQIGNTPWRTAPIGMDEAAGLARLLATACFIVIAYLSGARPGEVLNLQRGCISYDTTSNIWAMRGQTWKGATDNDGQHLPEGEPRDDPWTVVEAVAQAVAVLEALHEHRLLFPIVLDERRPNGSLRRSRRPGQARTSSKIINDIKAFIAWVNTRCAEHGLTAEQIPPDPAGPVSPSRFRRTLAWHIIRRPRGLVAGAIQYGHVNTSITIGYGGTSESGFPDEHAYEDWLSRLEQLADAEQRLAAGEHVSGPAADNYRHRVHTAQARFAGRVLTSERQAHDLLANPELQIYPGKAMTCVFDPAKAACQLRCGHDNATTPDQDDCRPSCRNIAYTDREITQLAEKIVELESRTTDPLAPSIRNQRDRHELHRIRAILARHRQNQE